MSKKIVPKKDTDLEKIFDVLINQDKRYVEDTEYGYEDVTPYIQLSSVNRNHICIKVDSINIVFIFEKKTERFIGIVNWKE